MPRRDEYYVIDVGSDAIDQPDKRSAVAVAREFAREGKTAVVWLSGEGRRYVFAAWPSESGRIEQTDDPRRVARMQNERSTRDARSALLGAARRWGTDTNYFLPDVKSLRLVAADLDLERQLDPGASRALRKSLSELMQQQIERATDARIRQYAAARRTTRSEPSGFRPFADRRSSRRGDARRESDYEVVASDDGRQVYFGTSASEALAAYEDFVGGSVMMLKNGRITRERGPRRARTW